MTHPRPCYLSLFYSCRAPCAARAPQPQPQLAHPQTLTAPGHAGDLGDGGQRHAVRAHPAGLHLCLGVRVPGPAGGGGVHQGQPPGPAHARGAPDHADHGGPGGPLWGCRGHPRPSAHLRGRCVHAWPDPAGRAWIIDQVIGHWHRQAAQITGARGGHFGAAVDTQGRVLTFGAGVPTHGLIQLLVGLVLCPSDHVLV